MLLSNDAALSNICISSPTAGDAGSVTVNAPPDVSASILSPATAVKFAVYAVHLLAKPLIAPVVVIVSINASLKYEEEVPKSTSESVTGPRTPLDIVIC